MIIERLGIDRIGIVTHSANLASLILRKAILNNIAIRPKRIAIVERSPVNKEIIFDVLEKAADAQIEIATFRDVNDVIQRYEKIFLICIGTTEEVKDARPRFLFSNIFLGISDKPSILSKWRLETWRGIRLSETSYLFVGRKDSTKIIIRDKELVEEEALTPILDEAFNIIVDSMAEFGELRISDVVNILKVNLGVNKFRAREIIEELIKHRKIKISKGRVELY